MRPFRDGLFRRARAETCDDPDPAPSAYRGPNAARPWTWRRARQNLLWAYAFGLLFLLLALPGVGDGVPTPAWRIGHLVVLAVAYLLAAWIADTSLRTRWAYVGGFTGLVLAGALVWGWGFANFGVYVAVVIAGLLPWRQSRVAIAVWGLALLIIAAVAREVAPLYVAALAVGLGIAMAGGIESGRVSRELEVAQRRVRVLSVAAERERIARDLHDILGHSLTAIAIKAGLAGRLVDASPSAARDQLAELEAIARQALADVRATAAGLTQVRLAGEIAGARSVLAAAGVEAETPSALPVLSDEVSELFGYVVREAVTNVVRHAKATRCEIAVSATEVRVSDDGSGRATASGEGRGLAGLAGRVAATGGTLEIDARPGAGTAVTARLAARPAPVR